MKVREGILQRSRCQQDFGYSFGDIEEILGTFCTMENIPEIMRLIDDQQSPFYLWKTFDQFGLVIIGCQYNTDFVFVLQIVLNRQIIFFDSIPIQDNRFKAELLQ